MITAVQSAPGRASWPATRASILGSDIGMDYVALINPADIGPREHFLNVLDFLAAAQTSLVLRLEDDVLVNKYITHNVKNWEAVNEPDFGVGWLFSPIAWAGRWPRCELNGSMGLLFKTKDVPEIMDGARQWLDEHPSQKGQPHDDLAVAHAVWRMGKRIYIHDPPLVEHRIDVPSSIGNVHTAASATTQGRFDLYWRAGE